MAFTVEFEKPCQTQVNQRHTHIDDINQQAKCLYFLAGYYNAANNLEQYEKSINELKNIITARAEIVQSKVRHQIELEKIDVLTDYYNKKIKELLPKK